MRAALAAIAFAVMALAAPAGAASAPSAAPALSKENASRTAAEIRRLERAVDARRKEKQGEENGDDEDFAGQLEELADLYLQRGDYHKAADLLYEASDQFPGFPSAGRMANRRYYASRAADVLMLAGDHTAAFESYWAAVRSREAFRDPFADDDPLYLAKARAALVGSGRLSEAIELSRAAADIDTSFLNPLVSQAEVGDSDDLVARLAAKRSRFDDVIDLDWKLAQPGGAAAVSVTSDSTLVSAERRRDLLLRIADLSTRPESTADALDLAMALYNALALQSWRGDPVLVALGEGTARLAEGAGDAELAREIAATAKRNAMFEGRLKALPARRPLSAWPALPSPAMPAVSPTPNLAREFVELAAAGRINEPQALHGEAFEAAQWGSMTAAAVTLTKVSARFAAGDSAVADLERQRLALLSERDRLAASAKVDESEAERVERWQRVAALELQAGAIEARIRKDFPEYFALARPDVLPQARVQSLLAPDEALLFIYSSGAATYSFALSRDAAAWSRAELPREEVERVVTALRSEIGEDLHSGGDSFDRSASYRLYSALVAPVESVLEGHAKLMVVSGGPLDRLPLAALRTDPGNAENAWLVDRYALSVLPAVNSLEVLRCLVQAGEDRPAGCTRTSARANSGDAIATALVGYGAPLLGQEASMDTPPSMLRNGLAIPGRLRTMPNLPKSATELNGIAANFGDGASAIHLGVDATEAALKRDGQLAGAGYLVLSTHGLLGTETGGEPGLVFTPPADGAQSVLDDGLLMASEAAQLNLRAQLVVLSACNTAGGGEALAGLARSFLFAGARSLLVSHWSVSDEATARLMRGIVSAYVAPDAARLQREMIRIRKQPGWSSPAFWAPFVLVGLP